MKNSNDYAKGRYIERIVDFSDSKTYPEEVQKIIMDSFWTLPSDCKKDIRRHNIRYSSDVGVSIENYYRGYLQEQLYYDCRVALEKYRRSPLTISRRWT